MSGVPWALTCVSCGTSFPGLEVRYRCTCGDVLDVVHDDAPLDPSMRARFDERRGSIDPIDRSGVWRFRELVLPLDAEHVVTRPEGNTNLYAAPALAAWCGVDDLRLKHEGENPTGSFKDRGMTVGISVAKRLGLASVACASTGNTSASMASYAAVAGMRAFVFIPGGAVAYGKLAQSLAYGARTIQIDGDFDAAMALVERVCTERGTYLLNSINPFRIEGQKAIAFELVQDLGWSVPDWIVVPGGNLGNSSAIFKGLAELRSAKLIPRLPRIAVVQATGADPFYRAFVAKRNLVPLDGPETLATAIRIGNPVSWRKSLRGVVATNGIVEEVTDQEIMDAKAKVDAAGIGAEPASCASVAGIKKLVARRVIRHDQSVVAILTGNLLKDPDAVIRYHQGTLDGIASTHANAPVRVAATLEAVLEAMK
ncbi:MAG TPA: threonine synthase [Candidatus Bathyarchaeia archaeon]|nr:threonine synthase [Candidatus Bathyarchaeia archaeon]